MLTASNVQLNADVIKGLQRLISIVEPIQVNMVNGVVWTILLTMI